MTTYNFLVQAAFNLPEPMSKASLVLCKNQTDVQAKTEKRKKNLAKINICVAAVRSHKFNESTYTSIGRLASARAHAPAHTYDPQRNIKSEDETLNLHFILLNGYSETNDVEGEKRQIQPTPITVESLKNYTLG